ncbi:MAG: hypothetical protein V3W41_09305, partial [Planctomycetota bacterium]
EVFKGMARMPTTTLFEAQNPTSLKERGDKSPNCPRLSWLLTTCSGRGRRHLRRGLWKDERGGRWDQ